MYLLLLFYFLIFFCVFGVIQVDIVFTLFVWFTFLRKFLNKPKYNWFYTKKMSFWKKSDLTFSCKGMQSWYIILPIHQLLLMDEMCMNCKKTCFKDSDRIFKPFFHIVFLELCKSFELLLKGLFRKAIRRTWEKME